MGCTDCGDDPGTAATGYQYAAKLVCGLLSQHTIPAPLNPGEYRTIVNIHNPSDCHEARLWWKVAAPGRTIDAGPMTTYQEQVLKPDGAIEITCEEAVSRILPLLTGPIDPNNAVFDGWLVLESECPLDVVAVYSAGPRTDDVSSIHTERVPGRRVILCEDLDFYLNTGTAAWESLNPQGQWVPAIFGTRPSGIPQTQWLEPAWPYDPPGTPERDQPKFRLCFELCAGAALKPVQLSLRADDKMLVKINGVIPSNANYNQATWPWHTINADGNSAASTINVPANLFVPGCNCIELTLADTWITQWGFSLAGRIEAGRGRCPGSALPVLPCADICYRVREFGGSPFGTSIWTGCEGQTVPPISKLLRSIMLDLTGAVGAAKVEHKVRIGSNWSPSWIPEGSWSPGAGVIEDVRMRLVNAPLHCVIRYRVLSQGNWTNWAQQGAPTNSTGPIWGLEVTVS